MNCTQNGCLTAAAMFGVPGILVLDADDDGRVLRLTVETVDALTACRCCGVVARAHGRRQHLLRDAPFGHRQVVVVWRKRVWRCDEPACPTGTWTEVHALAEPRAVLTNRAIAWATDALAADDTTVSALARRAGVGWHTLWRPVAREAARRAADPNRLSGVAVLGGHCCVVAGQGTLVRPRGSWVRRRRPAR